jgi:hypothetical protein
MGESVSMAAAPSARAGQVDLIERLAAAEGATTDGNTHAQYKNRFGRTRSPTRPGHPPDFSPTVTR